MDTKEKLCKSLNIYVLVTDAGTDGIGKCALLNESMVELSGRRTLGPVGGSMGLMFVKIGSSLGRK